MTLAQSLADQSSQLAVSLSFIENQISAAAQLRSQKELFEWLSVYVRHLAKTDKDERLREVLEEFLGPKHRPSIEPVLPVAEWDPAICGYSKRALLKKMLGAIGEEVRTNGIQELHLEFVKKLNDILIQEQQH